MPRSVNTVASRAKRKRILKQAKGYWGRRKNVWTVAKNAVEKVSYTHTEIEKLRKESSESFGFKESMLEQDFMECLTLSLWVN